MCNSRAGKLQSHVSVSIGLSSEWALSEMNGALCRLTTIEDDQHGKQYRLVDGNVSVPADVDAIDPEHLATVCSPQSPEVVVLGQVRWVQLNAPSVAVSETQPASSPSPASSAPALTRCVLVHLCTPYARSTADARLEADIRERRSALARRIRELK